MGCVVYAAELMRQSFVGRAWACTVIWTAAVTEIWVYPVKQMRANGRCLRRSYRGMQVCGKPTNTLIFGWSE
jgi:hypothetical protein